MCPSVRPEIFKIQGKYFNFFSPIQVYVDNGRSRACLLAHTSGTRCSYTPALRQLNSIAQSTPRPLPQPTTPSKPANTCPTFLRHDAQPQAAAVTRRRRKASSLPFLSSFRSSATVRHHRLCPVPSHSPQPIHSVSLLHPDRTAQQSFSKASPPLSTPAPPPSASFACNHCRYYLFHR